MSKAVWIVVLAGWCAAPAFAQYDGGEECWNPRAGHFERVRPGEYQNDLDFSRCRSLGYRRDRWPPDVPHECWTPHARHFERVRPGEVQDDLDFSVCHPIARSGGRECWNPRAGHFEAVREGERQDDLDFSRCRPR